MQNNSHLHIAQWLLDIDPTILLSVNIEQIYQSNSHLPILQWLYKIRPTININNYTTYSIGTCSNFDISKWLYQINPTNQISPRNAILFQKTLYIRIGDWLNMLYLDQFLWFHNTFVANNVHCKFYLLFNLKTRCQYSLSDYMIRNICLYLK